MAVVDRILVSYFHQVRESSSWLPTWPITLDEAFGLVRLAESWLENTVLAEMLWKKNNVPIEKRSRTSRIWGKPNGVYLMVCIVDALSSSGRSVVSVLGMSISVNLKWVRNLEFLKNNVIFQIDLFYLDMASYLLWFWTKILFRRLYLIFTKLFSSTMVSKI